MGHIDSLLATVVQCAHDDKEETKTSLLSSREVFGDSINPDSREIGRLKSVQVDR